MTTTTNDYLSLTFPSAWIGEPPQLVAACALRGVKTPAPEWRAIEDEHHRPFGITAVELLDDRIRVHHPELVISNTSATADETYAKADIVASASQGADYVDIFLWRGGALVAPATACLPYSNVWLRIEGWYV